MLRTALYQIPLSRSLVTPVFRLAQTAALRHPSLGLASSSSPAPARDALHARNFASSAPRRANEDPELQHLFQQQQKLLKHLQDNPETVEHIKAFVGLLQQNGVDPYSGQMPSKMAMLKLLMKPEIRESAVKMADALQAAGINLSQDMVQSLMTVDFKKQLGGK
ncbi:hypothetical protein C2E23DRAFT_727758 [Lenzites betulinus]|nr:hypothetical protein C2E23DRAFT_727758 [Lenzites betulinus]